jgi:hypothetical protein
MDPNFSHLSLLTCPKGRLVKSLVDIAGEIVIHVLEEKG